MYSTCLAFSMVRKTDDHFISSVATEYVKILWFSSLQIVNVIIIKCRTLLKSRRSRAFNYEILVLWSVLALPIRWYILTWVSLRWMLRIWSLLRQPDLHVHWNTIFTIELMELKKKTVKLSTAVRIIFCHFFFFLLTYRNL